MRKFAEFMDKVMADEAAKAEFGAVIGARKERELSDEDFQKIVELSEKLGAAVTLDEVKDFFSGDGRELSEEELEGVTAGLRGGVEIKETRKWGWRCPYCYRFFEVEWPSPKEPSEEDMRNETKRDIRYHLKNHFLAGREQKAEEIVNMDLTVNMEF